MTRGCLVTRLKADRLHHSGCLEDIDYRSARVLAKALILRLNRKHCLRDGLNLIISGPTGVRETSFDCALAQLDPSAGLQCALLALTTLDGRAVSG